MDNCVEHLKDGANFLKLPRHWHCIQSVEVLPVTLQATRMVAPTWKVPEPVDGEAARLGPMEPTMAAAMATVRERTEDN